jgi:U3 small nucleolar RNA-associated protein 24
LILTCAIVFPFGRKENIEKAAKKAEAEKVKEEKRRVYVLLRAALASWSRSLTQPPDPFPPIYRAPLPASMFLTHNTSLGPPYRILVDTNFINFSIQNKIELVQGMMDCLMAKCGLGFSGWYSIRISSVTS